MSEQARIGLRDLVVALIASITSIAGSYFVFAGNVKKADAEMVSTLYEQVQALQKTVFEQQTEIIALKIQLSKKYEQSEVLRDFLDAMPYPAWIKLVDTSGDSPKFVMWHINDKYAQFFDVSAARYVGNTDFHIWPYETAAVFYANDLKTLERMSPTCTQETFPSRPDSQLETSRADVCKWAAAINGRIAIAGQILVKKQ